MLQAVLIAIVIVVVTRDSFSLFPLWGGWPALHVVGVVLGAFAGLAVAVHFAIARCGRQLDRTGRSGWITLADFVLDGSRLLILALHAAAVLGLGWLDVVRGAVGDQVLLDEALAAAPAVLTIIAGYASFHGIEQRLAEASLIGALDRGEPVRPIRTRAQYIADQTRHQVALVLVPIAILAAWSESAARWARPGLVALLGDDRVRAFEWLVTAVHLSGVLVLILVMPMVLRRVWDTVPLAPGVLRDRLDSLCRKQGVRCREYLVWRTHGSMINGAMIGLVPWTRYILLTDALLERLPLEQIEAVMAHEVGHARRRHLPWLIGALAATTMLVWLGTSVGGAFLLLFVPEALLSASAEAVGGLGLLTALGVGWLVFGHVSRVFEQQADAFAVQHLSGWSARSPRTSAALTHDAVSAMAGALMSVARLNSIPTRKFTWRHGSIRGRCQRIGALLGRDASRLPIDRSVRRLKLAAAVLMLLTIGAWFLLPDDPAQPITHTAAASEPSP
jgi:STE24 endopeptidase